MKSQQQRQPTAANVLRWIARGLSVVFIGTLLAFFIGEADWSSGVRLTAWEWLGLAFFPVGIVVGMILGWWREGLGAAVALGSLLAFYLLNLLVWAGFPEGLFFLLFTSPALLFGVVWLLERGQRQAPSNV